MQENDNNNDGSIEGAGGELARIAGRLSEWAARRGIPTARFCRDYPGLGSERTFRDLRAGRTAGYDVQAQLAAYRGVLAAVEELSGDGAGGERVYDDLGPVVALRRAFAAVAQAAGTNRVVVVQGESGVGKTTAARVLQGRYGAGRVLLMEASDVWGDNPSCLLGGILRALGRTELPPARSARLGECQAALCLSRRCLVIDEAHHLGPHCLNAVKTLVNTTPGEFILVAIPSLWAKLQKNAYQEARQLTTNRLSERVQLRLSDADVARYLAKFYPDEQPASLRHAARLVRVQAAASGNMAFVRDTVRELRDSPPTPENVSKAVEAVAARR